jgi:nucleoside-diphosphate-sugar epimerase
LATIGELTGTAVEPTYLPPRVGDVLHSLADISLAEATLGYRPEVQLREGLERTIEHFHRLDAERNLRV